MRDLGAMVRVSSGVVIDEGHEGFVRDTVTSQCVGDEATRCLSLALEQPPQASLCRTPIPTRLDNDIDHVAVLIHRAPERRPLTVDRHEDLVEQPRISESTVSALQAPRVGGAELPAPLPNRLVGHEDASFSQQTLDIPEAQAVPVIDPHGVADDLRRKAMPQVAGSTSGHPDLVLRRTLT
jgi:hypothetical protein